METTFSSKRTVLALYALAGATWAGLIGTIFLFNAGNYDFWFPGRILSYVLLLVAPALTFIPVGRALGAWWYGWVAILGWTWFLFMLAFVPPNPTKPWNQNLVPLVSFLISLFLTVYSLGWPIFYKLGRRIFTRRTTRYSQGRSQREAIFLAIYVDSIFLMGALRILTPVYAVALFLIFLSIELLFLTRNLRNG